MTSGTCGTHEEKRNAYTVLMGKPERKRRHIWEYNIKMDLTEIGWDRMDWIFMA